MFSKKTVILFTMLFSLFITSGCSHADLSMTTEAFVKDIYLKLGPGETSTRYKGKIIELTGTVIEKGNVPEGDRLYVLLYENKPGRLVITASFSVDDAQKLNSIKVGDFIKTKGSFSGVYLQKNNWTRLNLDNAQVVN